MNAKVSKNLSETGVLAYRTVIMPADLNAGGTLFGGNMLCYYDLAGAVLAVEEARKPVVLAALNDSRFFLPVNKGDVVTVYAEVEKVGKTSLTIYMQAFKKERLIGKETMCGDARATYVCINEKHKPVPVR